MVEVEGEQSDLLKYITGSSKYIVVNKVWIKKDIHMKVHILFMKIKD